LALARALLGKGAKVVITGRRPDALAKAVEELQRAGSQVWSVTADVATQDGRAATIKQAFDALGGLDILVNKRAFRRTLGVAPHNWLLARRVEAAKEKLRDGRLSLLDVALACGFADQSHLTRVFTRMVGISPGAWRRALE
jgi:methylphosphotriester-DNA--protein-cysteine methyltransferase